MTTIAVYTGPFDPAYNQNYACYKEAEKRVVDWLRMDNNHTAHITINCRLTLARRSYGKGSQMPDDILADLNRTIEGRENANKHHKTIKENHDERHECPLNVLLEIKDLFEEFESSATSPFSSSSRLSRSSSLSSSSSLLNPSPKWPEESSRSEKERRMNDMWR